jgi:hypothetical protein
MGVTNRDASLTTTRRKQLALYAWRSSNQYSQNPQSVYPETSNRSAADVNVGAYLGGQLVGQTAGACPCSPAVTLQGYDKKSPAN